MSRLEAPENELTIVQLENAMTTSQNESALIEINQETALAVFTNPARYSEFYDKIRMETDSFVPNIGTKGGRDEIKSMAFKVVKVKTALDKQALALTEDWRAKTAAVNASRKKMTTELDSLANAVRQPLTKWEEAEAARIRDCETLYTWIKDGASVSIDDTSAQISSRIASIEAAEISKEQFLEMFDTAEAAKVSTLNVLKSALVRIENEEAGRAELKRLQAAEIERKRIEDEKAAQAAEERRKIEHEAMLEARRIADENAEKERIEKAKEEAAKAATLAATHAAEKAAREREEAHTRELAEAKDRADKAEADKKAEADRIAKIEAAKIAAEKAAAEEQAARDADKAHRSKIKTLAKQAIMSCGADEETAKKIVLSIIAGEVPNVTLRF